ncbi:R10B2 protein, partial [Hemiprocne comata]|nr:R10B2 protein [Hemiprocne comata]
MAKDKNKEGKKAEKSVCPIPAQDTTAESNSAKLTDTKGVEETQKNPVMPDKKPEEVEEPAVQDVSRYYEEPVLTQVIVISYEGEKVCGLYEGEGFACFEGGNTYKGMFSEGLMHGQGTYTWADGVKYEGTFVKNVQMFNGRYTWNDGSIYEGSIQNGFRHGFGFFRSATHPVSYIGYWCKGKRHGKGTIYYDQEHTSWYSGDWVNNVKEGWGIRCYKSGNIYEGQWEKNVRHGKGRMRWLTANQEYIGQWVYGIQHGYGTHIWFLKRMPVSQYSLRNEYVGDFVNGQRHGHGKFIYASGAVYDGEWVCNKKHGKGKFVLKNGHIYEGEFIDDHVVEYPAFQVDALNAKKLNAICTGSNSGTGKQLKKTDLLSSHFSVLIYFICMVENITVINSSENTSILGSNIELDISSLLNVLPREERDKEVKQVEFAVLRHITELRRIYIFYSSLGCDHSSDNTFLMTKFQFWRFLKDCQFHHANVTLAEMDRILRGLFILSNFLGDKTPLEETHCPHETLLFRTFLSYLTRLAFHIYHEEHKEKGPYLHKCFLEMMSRNVIPAACRIQGILFSEEQCTVLAMSYIDKCWEIYKTFRRPRTKPPFEPTMKMRHFLWMLKDFKLLSKQLTASRVVEILVKDGPSLHDSSTVNLEQELVFLEFVEALLGCALVYVTSDMIKEQVDQDDQKRRSFRIEGPSERITNASLSPEYSLSQVKLMQTFVACSKACCFPAVKLCSVFAKLLNKDFTGCKLLPVTLVQFRCTSQLKINMFNLHVAGEPEAKTEQDEEFSLWMHQVQIFFTTKLFPAYQHEKVLREKIKENRIQDAELAGLRNTKDEELAKEAEEAKTQAAAAAEVFDSRSSDFKESERPVTPPLKEEAPIAAPPIGIKVPAGKKRKK